MIYQRLKLFCLVVMMLLVNPAPSFVFGKADDQTAGSCSIERRSDALFSPNGEYILSTWDATTAKLWSIKTGKVIQAFTIEDDKIFKVAFSSDGSIVATGANKGKVILWDSQTGKQKRIFVPELDDTLPIHYVRAIFFTPNNKYMLTDDFSGGARLWDVQTGEQVYFFPSEEYVDGDDTFLSPNGNFIITQGKGHLDLWDIQTHQQLYTFDAVVRGGFSSTGKLILTWNSPEGATNLWDMNTYKKVQTFEEGFFTWKFSTDDKYLVVYDKDSTTLWDTRTAKKLHYWSIEPKSLLSYVAFSPNNRHLLLTIDPVDTILVWDVVRNKEASRFTISYPYTIFLVSPDGKYLLSDNYDYLAGPDVPYNLYLWDIETGKRVYKLC